MEDHERLLQTFRSLLAIDSPSGQEAEIAVLLMAELRHMGFQVRQDTAGNVIGEADGQGEPFMLCAHMDTVESTAGLTLVEADGLIRSDGSTILGADDKAGVSIILEAVRRARAKPPLEVVFTVHEEGGLHGAKALDTNQIRAREGLVLDSGGPIGSIVVGAPSQVKVTATVRGRAAHAGVAPEQGVNAIVLGARALATMPLGRIDSETTANVGVIQGGLATNIVPDVVTVRGEARSHSRRKLEVQAETMRLALAEAAVQGGGSAEVEVEDSYTAFRLTEETPLVASFMRVARAQGIEPRAVVGGGGSDANVFNLRGITVANMPLGSGGHHSKQEWAAPAEMEAATRLLVAILEDRAGR